MGRFRSDNMSRSRKGSKNLKNTNEDVQRAIEGLKEIPDDELQEFLDDEELQDLNVVDAWEGDEDQIEQRDNRGRHQHRNSGNRNRRGRRRGFGNRCQDLRDKHEEKKREDARRDPSKSSKDIERDKMRTRRDNETKILAEKEKAIKSLLDSDTVVPPGTEVEAIETFDKQIQNNRNNRDHQRSSDRHRNQNSSPCFQRSRGSPRGRGRNTFFDTPERRRRTSWDRKSSLDRRERRISPDRQFRRRNDEREFRLSRRSRSSIRSRSRDRSRRRWSRSPIRGSGHSDSRRRSTSKSPERRRKRSPFLHEIARQLNNDALLSGNINNQGFNQQIQPLNIQPPQNHHGNLQLPSHHYGHPETMVGPYPVPQQFEPQPPVQTVMNFEPIHQPIHPHIDYNPPPQQQQQPLVQALPPPHALFNQMPRMVNNNQVYQAPVLLPTPNIPQPVPAPMQTDQFIQHSSTLELPQLSPDSNRRISDEHRYRDDFIEKKIRRDRGVRHNRLVTPEPPIISDKKLYEKTSLSSLLEASVSAKGFKPEIIKNCEQALRELPDEDHRLRMKGRFFYDSKSEDEEVSKQPDYLSNSILLQKNKTNMFWLTNDKKIDSSKNTVETHQKYCQTEIEYNDVSVQTSIEMIDFCVQVCPGDLKLSPSPSPREDKRPIMDRLDWNVRDHIDYGQREADDLRWSLSSNQKRSYKRTLSPDDDIIRQNIVDINQRNFVVINHNIDNNNFNQNLERPIRDGLSPSPHDYRPHSPLHNRNDTFHDSPYRSNRTNYNQHNNDRYSPNFRRNIDNYDDNISQHSRNRSPDIIEERNDDDHHHRHGDDDDVDDDVQVLDNDTFTRESSWRERGSNKTFGSSTNSSHKSRPSRGKFTPGRSFRARGNSYRGRY